VRRNKGKDEKEEKFKFVREKECPTKKKIIINFSAKKIKNIYYTDYFNVRAPLVNQAKQKNIKKAKKRIKIRRVREESEKNINKLCDCIQK
jgi:hypothetical protein